MPLRKKHVRYSVFALVMVGVLGVLTGLVVYGLHVRGGAYGRAIETALASRLRCEAALGGARPTGLSTAAAETVTLAWTAAGGRLTLDLRDAEAVRNPDGTTWTVTAATGRLALTGPDPAATLSAINQRLVQVEADVPVTYLYVQRLDLSLALEPLDLQAETRAVLVASPDGLEVRLFDAGLLDRSSRTLRSDSYRLLARMRLKPTDEGGVFAGLHADLADMPADALRRALGLGQAPRGSKGAAHVTVNWHWPGADPRAGTVSAAVRGLELAAWTSAAPGGRVEGTADLAIQYRRQRSGEMAVALRLEASDCTMAGETLQWLDGLAWPVGVPGAAPKGRVPLERFSVSLLVADGRGRFAGQPGPWGGIPLATVRLLGHEVPVLWADPKPFDAHGLWAAVRQGLGVDANGHDRPPPAAYARADVRAGCGSSRVPASATTGSRRHARIPGNSRSRLEQRRARTGE